MRDLLPGAETPRPAARARPSAPALLAPLRAGAFPELQRSIGNAATSRLVVQRATIGDQLNPGAFGAARLNALLRNFTTTASPANRWKLADVLLDPAFAFDDALALAADIGNGMLRENIRDPVTFASCYPTAQHLFPLLSGIAAQPGESSEQLANRAAGGAAVQGQSNGIAALPDANTFRAEVGRLVASMQGYAAAGNEAVFRVEFAGHGFTLVLRHPQAGQPGLHVELIESLAHSASMDDSLRQPGRDPGAVYQALQDMADDDHDTRVSGAEAFGWNADALFLHDAGQPGQAGYPISSYPGQANAIVGEYFPRTRMKWWANPLSPTAVGDWRTQAESRLTRLEALFAQAAGGGGRKRQKRTVA
ncbi:hypothetical protein [Actinorhabdospora filicis]|nr:hypothetical protein [Actinorhabdospora filicis]